jgi:hypothetical protein
MSEIKYRNSTIPVDNRIPIGTHNLFSGFIAHYAIQPQELPIRACSSCEAEEEEDWLIDHIKGDSADLMRQ